MAYSRKLGIFVKVPRPGKVKTRLVPPLSPEEACELYGAFLEDLFVRLARLKKIDATVFYAGDDEGALRRLVPEGFDLRRQHGAHLGERLCNAFGHLLGGESGTALIIGSDSPDVPLVFLKRAWLKLKRKDVVLGPSSDGGYYLIGLRKTIDPLFEGVTWGSDVVLEQTLDRIHRNELAFSLLPIWYDVDSPHSLALLQSMLFARRIERRDRLQHTERVLAALNNRGPRG
ncbi:MAG: TIGR04282 family arsenosugar biosynthesis glycosyltransferase [Candidatus Krumholzibacteriia bacterium]